MAGADAEEAVIPCRTENEFDAEMAKAKEAGKLVIIDFMATWCGPCKQMAPVYADCANKYPAAVFLEVDIDELKEVAKKYNVYGVPTYFFIRNGEELESFSGADPDMLEDTIKKYYDVDGTTPASASG